MTCLRCPSCGGEMSLDVLIANNHLRQATVDLVEKGLALGSLVMRYVALFRPATNRMSPDRFAKLVLQLMPDVNRGAIHIKGRDWLVSRDQWERGFEAMLEKAAANKLTLPLENHNYLYTVLAGLADKVEAVQEQEELEQERHQARPAAPAGPLPVAEAVTRGMPEHIREQMAAIRRGDPITTAAGGTNA